MKALAVCVCEHAVVLHEGFSPEKDEAGECLVCRVGKLPCYNFNWNDEHFINQLIREMEQEEK